MVNRGIVVSTGKFETLIFFDTHQDGEVRKISNKQVVFQPVTREGGYRVNTYETSRGKTRNR